MNLKNRLRHIANMSMRDRQYGKTTLLARITKDLDGVLLCRDHRQAVDVSREHGVTTKSMETNLEGLRGPFFMDHYALEELLMKAYNKIEHVESHFLLQEKSIENLQVKLAEATARNTLLKEEIRDLKDLLEEEKYHAMDQQELNDE